MENPRITGQRTRPIQNLIGPFVRFAQLEAAGGILLAISTVVALVWANSQWAASYEHLWHTNLSIGFGKWALVQDLHEWINDGLMAIFFFLVGLEIKREFLVGELSNWKNAAFPIAAAIGGTVLPALFYLGANRGGAAEHGWGIPMATDIAFTLGVLALLGNRVPLSLKVFVTALAIVDDILAVLVIAVFYTEEISFFSLGMGLFGIAVSYVANRMGVRKPIVYALIGAFVWLAMLKSGVHATIAGILLAFTIPAKTYLDPVDFLAGARKLLQEMEHPAHSGEALITSEQQQHAIHELEEKCELVQPPLHRIEHALQPWVTFAIMPIFALANAGVPFLGSIGPALKSPVTLGILAGLFVGKPLGISLFAWLSTKMRVASLPEGVLWRQILGVSWLCGIGFTMSLFIAALGLGDAALIDIAKIAILAASLGSAMAGSLVLLATRRQTT
jgi:NhaA family Na+:H+ antiporter